MSDALLRQRIIVLDGVITDDVANVIIAQMLFLDAEAPRTPMHLRLRTMGGHVSSTLAIRDTMDALSSPVHVHAIGNVSGIALWILAHGARGQRTATPNSVLGLTPISASKPTLTAELERTEAIVVDMLASDTGLYRETILQDMHASRSFTAEEARAYGLVDVIVR